MSELRIEVKDMGFDLEKLPKSVAKRTLVLTANGLREEVANTSPKDTTDLRKSWAVSGSGDDERRVSTNLKYAVFVNEGTGIYVGNGPIRPKKAKALHFVWNGEEIFAKSVKGQPGQHFVEEAIDKVTPRIKGFIGTAIQEAGG